MITLGSKVRITLTASHLAPDQSYETTVTAVCGDELKVALEGCVYYFDGKSGDGYFISRGARYSQRIQALIAYVHVDVEHPELTEPHGHEWMQWVEINATIEEIR